MTLNCSADGNPPPVISWTRVSDNSAVVFPWINIELQHEGSYRCTANNSVGSAVTGDVSIVVKGTTFTFMRDLQYIASILKHLRSLTDNNYATATGEIPHVQIVLFADFLSSIYNKTYTAG